MESMERTDFDEYDYTELIGFCPECGRELDNSTWNGECETCENYGE